MEQLALFPPVDDREVRRVVARQLKDYKAYKVAMENKNELEEASMVNTFPVINDSDKEKLLIINQIERALTYALDDVEREVIERKYLSKSRVKDISVYMDMGLTKDQYYVHKKEAIRLIASALRII